MASTRSSTTERQTRPRLACAAAGVRIKKARGRGFKIGSPSAARGALGDCRSSWQGRPRPNGSNARLGTKRANDWLLAAAIDRGKLFRRVNKVGRAWGEGITEKAVWHIVEESAKTLGIAQLAPHDLRRTCARLCHASGDEREQIQFLLGHVSVQTTERYLGCKQRIRSAVNDRIGIEPSP